MEKVTISLFLLRAACPSGSEVWGPVISGGVILFLIAYSLAAWWRERAWKKRFQQRWTDGYNAEQEYYAPLLASGVSRETAEAVLEYLRDVVLADRHFPVQAADRFYEDYNFVDIGELDDMLEDLLVICNRSRPDAEALKAATFLTVQDFVVWLDRRPKDED